MIPLCPHHLSEDSETTDHTTVKGELRMSASLILYVLVITKKRKRIVWG